MTYVTNLIGLQQLEGSTYMYSTVLTFETRQLATIKDELLFWKDDLPFPKSLDQELRRWEDLWKRKKTSPFGYDQEQLPTVNIPDNFLLSLTACDSHSFPNIHRLLIIGCTLPITSAEAERTFSLMRRIKTFA